VKGLFLVLFVWIFGCDTSVTTDILRIETQTGVTVAGDQLKVRVTATNKGTGTAHNVQVHLLLLAERRHGPVKGQLNPGGTDTVLFKRTLAGIKKGRYPLTVLVDFHDVEDIKKAIEPFIENIEPALPVILTPDRYLYYLPFALKGKKDNIENISGSPANPVNVFKKQIPSVCLGTN